MYSCLSCISTVTTLENLQTLMHNHSFSVETIRKKTKTNSELLKFSSNRLKNSITIPHEHCILYRITKIGFPY